jgi:hypothetical protein
LFNILKKQAAIISTSSVTPEIRIDQPLPSGNISSPNSKSNTTTTNLSEIQRQQEELDRRAAEIERREKILTSSTIGDSKINLSI